ncbi:MAG: hypothetical protein SFY56_15340 [Bacteroidota bacterium]|nr:hypothetical protein [Bacteroidota bacterium]
MKTTTKMIAYAVAALALTFTACKKKDKDPDPVTPPPQTPQPQELITTMKVMISNGTVTTTYMFKDPDGDGGQAAFYGPGTTSLSTQADSVINLVAMKNYTVNILLLDESKNPVDTISNEVSEEGADHMFFFNQANPTGAVPNTSVVVAGTNLTVKYLDNDGASTPRAIGLSTEWITGAATTNKAPLKITLKHQPGVKDGTYAPGDSDIEVTFKVKVN